MNIFELKLQISNAKKIVLLSEPNSWKEGYWTNVVTQLEYMLNNSSTLININKKVIK